MSGIIRLPHVALLWSLLAAAIPLDAGAQSPTGKWLAEQDPPWQANYQNEVTGPYDKAFGELKMQYTASLEALLTAVAQDAKLDDAAKIRSERDRVAAGDLPPDTDPSALPALRTLRAECARILATLALDRQARAKGLYDRYDGILDKNQTTLTKSKRIDEALEIKARRDRLKAEWLTGRRFAPKTKWVKGLASAKSREDGPAMSDLTARFMFKNPANGETAPLRLVNHVLG